MIPAEGKTMKFLMLFTISLIVFLFYVAVQKTNAAPHRSWEVSACPANGFQLKTFTTNEISMKSSSYSIKECQKRTVIMNTRVTSKNAEAVKLGRLGSSKYSGDVIISDESKLEKEFKLHQMKLFPCVEYKIHLELISRTCRPTKARKIKCSGNEKKDDRTLDSTDITAFLNDVDPVEYMVLNNGYYCNITRFYLSISPEMQFCDLFYNFTVYSTDNKGTFTEMVYESVLSRSGVVDVPNLKKGIQYKAFIGLKINDKTIGIPSTNQVIPFNLEKSTANETDWNLNSLHVESFGPTWVNLAWEPPDPEISVKRYFLELFLKNGSLWKTEQLASNTRAINLTESLTPCSIYRIDITTISKKLLAFSTINITTGHLGEVQNLTVEIDDMAMIASWEPPFHGKECVSEYVVQYQPLNATLHGELENNSSVTILTANTTQRLYNLTACTVYSITVNAMAYGNETGQYVSVNQTTPPKVFPAPDHGKVVELWTSGAILSWQVAYTLENECEMEKLVVNCYDKAGKAFEFFSTERYPNGTVLVYCLVLEPFTEYSCRARAVNSAGESESSLPLSFETLQDVPSPPMSVKVEVKTSDSLVVSWEKPEIIPGILTKYTAMIRSEGPAFPLPDDCTPVNPGAAQNETVFSEETFATFGHLLPFYQYDVSVIAATEAGYGDSSPVIRFRTLPTESEAVRNLTINVHYNESVVTWRPPCLSNGIIANYSLKLTGSRNKFNPIPSKHWYISRDQNWDYLRDLYPETTYELSISALVEDTYEENPLIATFTSSARIPVVPTKLTQDLVEVDPKLSSKPSREAEVLIKKSFFNSENGKIRYLALLVAEEPMLTDSRSGIIDNRTWPHMTTWAVATSSQQIIMYQATPMWWNPLEGSESDIIHFTLGQVETCHELDIHTYCNGPLMPNTLYAMRIRVFTSAGYRDSGPIRFKTDFGFPYDLIMGLFLALFVVTWIVLISAYIYLSKRRWKSGKTEHKYLEELPAKKLLAHTNVVLEHKNLMHSEFLHLNAISDTLDITSDVSKLQINMPKNRYTNILPYDFNRVILEGEEECDYINASYITDETLRNEVEYVACQAPKENTVLDFWKMIVQCGIRAIVMLCKLRENNKEKCHWYFPEEFETFDFGDISVNCSKKFKNDSFIQSLIVINVKDQGELKVNHYHFVDWPDFQAPSEAIPMIKLCQAVRADVGLATIAVHCSAGVGRTGTYIAIDMLLRHLNHRKKVNVFRTVLKLRGQRAHMVQNEIQYAYIYKVLKHTLDNPTLFFRKGSRLLPSSRSNSSSLDGHSLLSFSMKVRS